MPARGRRSAGAHPILEAIARTAARLCEAGDAQIVLIEGGTLRPVAQHGSLEASRKLGEPFPLSRGTVYGRAALERRAIQVRDLKAVVRTQYPDVATLPRATRVRTMLAMPLLSEGTAIGVIAIRRRQVRPFTSRQMALLQTFAEQAAIALEKSRLSEELATRNRDLTEALDHQRATSEILRVISTSPAEVRSVFEAIVGSARRLCEASFSSLNLVEGDQLTLTAADGMDHTVVAAARQAYPQPITRGTTAGRAILERRVVHMEDTADDPEYTNPVRGAMGLRSVLTVPMFQDSLPIGAVSVWRSEVRPFGEKQIALLRTLADQAVIAIGNARLFTELQGKNRALTAAHARVTEALEQQTATSDILGAISTSTMDAQPVFQTIAEAAVRLCGAAFGSVYRFDGDLLHMVAQHNYPAPALDFSLRTFPTPPSRELFTGRAVLERAVIHVPDVLRDEERASAQQFAEVASFRSVLSVPMLREGNPIGAITLWGSSVGAFSEGHVALLKTFADQAVIAMENTRLFKELEARNLDLTEGLERERATGEILRVISSSPTDIQPVLEAILDSAKRLCEAQFGAVFRFEGDAFVIAASTVVSSEFAVWLRSHPVRPGAGTPLTRAGVERRPVQVADILADPDFAPPDIYRREGMRTALAVPMLKDDALVGALTFHRHTVQPFTEQQIALLETFAAQAVIAIENVRLFTELEARNQDLTGALERQTATSEILRVISSSPVDVQPVFDTIVASATRLCNAESAAVYRFENGLAYFAAGYNFSPESLEAYRHRFPRPLAETDHLRRVTDGSVLYIPDMQNDPHTSEAVREDYRRRNARSTVWVPMLREGRAIGVVAVSHRDLAAFSAERVDLLKTFADQAVIAIENVRLFKELEARNRDLSEALEQQTATAEILRVISTSPTNLQPVLDALAASAARFCGSYDGSIFHLDGNTLRLGAHHGPLASDPVGLEVPVVRGAVMGRSILDREAVHVADLQAETQDFPEGSAIAKQLGFHTLLCVPLLREGAAIGAIGLRRIDVSPFTDKQIALAKTFADQAVIAIENVRLFTELEARNRDLTEALEQQTATSEILRVISQSQTDVQPVFDTIVQSAVKLCDAVMGNLQQFDGERMHFVAAHNISSEALELIRRQFPRRLDRSQGASRAVLNRAVVNIADVLEDPDYQSDGTRVGRWRSVLSVPMLREGKSVGAITVARAATGTFADNQVDLLKTFADQAVIAVENVRLFKELQARTTELTQSVEQLTALGEVSRAVSSTLDVETVLDTVVSRASELAGADGTVIYEYDEATRQFHVRSTHGFDDQFVDAIQRVPVRKGEGTPGRAAQMREPFQVADITVPGAYEGGLRNIILGAGYRSALSVPLLREDEVIGTLTLTRRTPGDFPPGVVEMLKTFATQSALAIQNARLFREIEDKGRELELASKHKSQFLANMSHELRTPLNAILGYTELLLDGIYGAVPERARETMGRIERSGRHLLALINDVLDLSKIEAGQLTLSLADYSLSEIVNTVVTAMEPLAAEKGLALRVELDPGLPLARGDDRRLSQVLLNLVGNAVKFTDAGEVRIRGKVSDGAFLVSVSDTGLGIAGEDQARIFDEFQQVDTSNTRKKGGTGLGLSIARRILALHGGRIWVESAPGQGATFSFTLPVRVERMVQA